MLEYQHPLNIIVYIILFISIYFINYNIGKSASVASAINILVSGQEPAGYANHRFATFHLCRCFFAGDSRCLRRLRRLCRLPACKLRLGVHVRAPLNIKVEPSSDETWRARLSALELQRWCEMGWKGVLGVHVKARPTPLRVRSPFPPPAGCTSSALPPYRPTPTTPATPRTKILDLVLYFN